MIHYNLPHPLLLYCSVPLQVMGVTVFNEVVMWHILDNQRGYITQYQVKFFINSVDDPATEGVNVSNSEASYHPNITSDIPPSGQPVKVSVSTVHL